MGERVLTVRDRIIVHLSAFNRYADEFECPEEMCQSGISMAIGKSRAHITLELNRMKEAGLVYERNARIKGAKSKRKTYLLTQAGILRNSEINNYLDTFKIEMDTENGPRIFPGTEAADFLRSKFGMLRVNAVDSILDSGGGVLDLSTIGKPPPKNDGSCDNMPPRLEKFIPRKEMEKIVDILDRDNPNTLMLLGIPGIGKTALLAELAWTRASGSPVMYRRLYPFDSPVSVFKSIAEFMEGKGAPGLRRMMNNLQNIDYPEAKIHISRFLENGKYLLIFDEFENAPVSLSPIFTHLMEIVKNTGSCIIISSSRKGGFYSHRNLTLEDDIREITMEPLDNDSSRKILGGNVISEEHLKIAGGHPLTLRLLAAGMAPVNLASYIENDILGKDSDMAKLCRLASVLRKPFLPDDLEMLGFSKAADIKDNIAFEAQPGGGYLLHSAISSIMIASTSKRMLRELHSRAAEFYSRENADAHEAMHHLIQANRIEETRKFALANSEALLASENQEELASIMELVLWGGCESVELMELASEIMDRAGKWERAGKLAMEIEKCVPGTAISIKSRILRANILGKTGELKKSLSILDEMDGYSDDSELPARIQYIRSSTLRRLGRIDEAKKACKKAIALSKGPKRISLHAQCQMENAMIFTAEGKHQKALTLLESAKKDFEKMGSVQDMIRCDINLGMVLRACDRIEDAITVLERAAKASERAGLNRFKAHALANLTDLLNRTRQFERSATLAREAISIFTGLGEPLMQAAAMLNLCGAEAGLGRKESALGIMKEAIALLDDKELLKTRGSWVAECADILRGMGEDAKADELLARYTPDNNSF